jgi:hypothetical protein
LSSTQEVLDLLECFGRGVGRHPRGLLVDGRHVHGGRPLKGPASIRPLFQAIFSESRKSGASFSMKQRSVDGDYAYILRSAETADNVYEMGTDTFVVRNGQILAHSFAGKIRAKG